MYADYDWAFTVRNISLIIISWSLCCSIFCLLHVSFQNLIFFHILLKWKFELWLTYATIIFHNHKFYYYNTRRISIAIERTDHWRYFKQNSGLNTDFIEKLLSEWVFSCDYTSSIFVLNSNEVDFYINAF